MRDPRQEARRIPASFSDTTSGSKRVNLHHEVDGIIECPDGVDYAEAALNAQAYIDQHYPGRTL